MPKDLQQWMARINRAEQLQSERKQERLQAIKLYTGTFFGSPINNNTEMSEVNFLYEFVDVLVSAIYARDPHIFVRATSGKMGGFAETMEEVINHEWRRLKLKKKMISCIIDSILQPPGFIGVGYTFISEQKKFQKEIEREFPELKDPNKTEKTESEQGILDETIKFDDCFAEHISSWNVLWPDGYHVIRDCPYLFVKQRITLEDLHANPLFNKNKFKISGNSSTTVNSTKPKTMRDTPLNIPLISQSDKDLIVIDLFHVWDRRGMEIFTMARNFTDGVLFEKKWDYLPTGFPFFDLIFNEIPATDEKANSYPLSDVIPMFPQLKELSLLASAMMRHRKRAGTLLLGKKGQVSEVEADQIQRSKDVDMVLLDDISENAVRGFTPPALPQDFYALREAVLEDLFRISGYQQLLGSARGVETATESENIRAGAVLRQTRRIDVIEDFSREVAIYLAGLIWQFKTRAQIEEIIGEPVDEEMWPTVPEDLDEARRIIQKQINFYIEAGSTRPPKDEAVERKQWMDLTGTIKANFPGRIKDDVYLKQLLKKFDYKDIEKMIIGFDDEETAVAQEENKLLMQNIPQLVGPNENDLLHLQVHAQVYQVPGMTPTDAMNQHVAKHAENLERKNPTMSPQKGDSRIAPKTTTPDQKRQGVPEYADILGGIRSQEGIGGNKGGN